MEGMLNYIPQLPQPTAPYRRGIKVYINYISRQIRNAFQTAIALTEHESMNMEQGDPKPSLGKVQFEIVAQEFGKFDEYLTEATGATDADMAKREGIRDDAFLAGASLVPVQAPLRPTYASLVKKQARPLAYDSESDEESDSVTDSEEEEDEEVEKEKQRGQKRVVKGKSAYGYSKK